MSPTEREPSPNVLDRVNSVFSAFGEDDRSLTLTQLIARTGLPRSTCHRLAEELVRQGWLTHTSPGYALGMRLFEIGQRVPQQRDLVQLAEPYMEDLRTATGSSVHFAVLDGADVVYLHIVSAKSAPPMRSRRGGRLPAHATGVGKAMLAFSPDQVVDRVIAAGLPRLTPQTICDPDALRAELATIREQGIAFDRQENAPGLLCAAVPLFDAEGTPKAALSVSGFSASAARRMAPAVQTAALALNRSIAAHRWKLVERRTPVVRS